MSALDRWACVTVLLFLASTPAAGAQLTVGAGASLDLGTGSLDLGCADLSVAGTVSAGTVGFSQARDVATLEVAGDWDNAGSFNGGTSTVGFVDGCSLLSAVVAGNTTFADLEMTTTSGFLYSFEAGSTQTVTGSLALAGASDNLLTIRSTLDGSEAFLDLDQAATGSFVDVKDNHTTDQPVTLDPGSVISGNAPGWSLAVPLVPALSLLGLAALGAGLYLTGHWTLFRRARADA
jgi:hypothetical protein